MDSQKKVDESWKEAVLKEKAVIAGAEPQARPVESQEEPPESEFLGFISTLVMQTLMAMGEVPHPETRQRHEDLTQAKYLIDILQILSDKTLGNLTPHEETEMKNLLYQLKMKFVQKEGGIPQ